MPEVVPQPQQRRVVALPRHIGARPALAQLGLPKRDHPGELLGISWGSKDYGGL